MFNLVKFKLELPVTVLLLLVLLLLLANAEEQPAELLDKEGAIDRFRQYLQIRSVHPEPDYASTTKFLVKQAERIGLSHHVLEVKSGKPVVIMEWSHAQFTDRSAQSIMLNSHTDVVPVDMDKWASDPFEAHYNTTTGQIFARGAQDMKCVGMQYLEAIDLLKNKMNAELPKRPVYITFVPDEEIGGHDGMEALVTTDTFQKMNVGLGLDEGLSTPTDHYQIYNGERCAWWVFIRATGPVGHGSAFVSNTATEKIARVIGKVFEFRESQEREMALRRKKYGDVVTINLTSMKAGHTNDCGKSFTMNVIPASAQIGLDIRVPPHVNQLDIERMVLQWAPPSDGYEIEHVQRGCGEKSENPVVDLENPFVKKFLDALHNKLNLKTEINTFPASTDARFVRLTGVPVIGFSPMINTPVLLHDHNEYLTDSMYLEGIHIYKTIIGQLSE